MKYLMLFLVLSPSAYAIGAADCASQGKSFVQETVTSSGVYKRAHCRSKPKQLSDQEKAARFKETCSHYPNIPACKK